MTNILSEIRNNLANQLGIIGGTTFYDSVGALPLSGNTTGDQALVTSTNRLYLWNSGWYNIALINNTPTFTTAPDASYTLATDLSGTVINVVAQDSEGIPISYSATISDSASGIATLAQGTGDSSNYFTVTPLIDSGAGGSFSVTFRASDGVNIASALSTFTLTFGPDWANATESILRASDAQANDYFGTSVSMSSDGTYAIVGSIGPAGGAAYVFSRSGSTWTQQAKLASSDLQASDEFGFSVSISSDGSYAIVGATGEDTGGSSAGAAYIFTRSGSTWTQQQKIQSSDIQASDYFGYSVSINSDATIAIVGAWWEDGGAGDPVSNAGAAYIFTRSGSTWTQQAKITASDAQADDRFGNSVSISGDGSYAIVGAYTEDTGGNFAGAAYVFTRSGSTWTQQQKIQSSDIQASDSFGQSVAMSSDGSYAIVGAFFESTGGSGAGAAYVFTRSGSTWTQQAKLASSDLQANDRFGWSVLISSDGSYAIVGALNEGGGSGDPIANAGAAYVFERDGSTWTEIGKLTASDPQASDFFGYSVAMSSDGSYAIVGARGEDGGVGDPLSTAGAAYIYEA